MCLTKVYRTFNSKGYLYCVKTILVLEYRCRCQCRCRDADAEISKWSIKQYRCLKNVIYQIDKKNEWLLHSSSFTAKFGLAFVLTRGFILKPAERA